MALFTDHGVYFQREMEMQLTTQSKQLSAQMFVMNNLRNGIEYLKRHCQKSDGTGKAKRIFPLGK